MINLLDRQKKRTLILVGIGVLFILFNCSCKKKNPQDDKETIDLTEQKRANEVILELEGNEFYNSDFTEYVRNIVGDDLESFDAVTLSNLLDNFIEEKILIQAAKKNEVSITKNERKAYMENISTMNLDKNNKSTEKEAETLFNRLLVEKYIYEMVKDIKVQDDEIKEYYEAHKKDFFRPGRIMVSQVLLKTKEKAIEIRKRLQNSSEDNFRKIARTESAGVEATNGGKMGTFEVGQFPIEMEKRIFSLEEGELSPVVESPYGYHIFRLDKKFKADLISEEEALSSIRMKILDDKIEKFFSRHMEELKKNMNWKLYEQNLPFPHERNKL